MNKNLTVVTFVIFVSFVVALDADWPQWRGPARDGVATAFTPPATWPAQLTKKWQIPVGAGHASPVIAGNRVILHSRVGTREVIAAYDVASGKQLWQDGIEAPYTMNPAARGHGPGPKSTPTIADGRVFTFGISGIFSAHDLNTGKLLWRKNAPKTPPEFGTAMSPLVDGIQVIAHLGGQGGGALTSMDVATGAVKWQWTGDGPAYASPIIATFSSVRQVITQTQNKIVGVDLRDGKLLWELPMKTPYEQNSVTPIVVNNLLIYAGLENPTVAVRPAGGPGMKWSAPTVWSNEQVSMYMSSPVSGNWLFGLSNKNRGQFFAIEPNGGKTLWLSKGREAENASLVRAGNFLLVGTTNSELIVLRATMPAYEEVKRYVVADSAMWAHPAFTGRTIIVKDVDKLTAWGF